MSAVAYIELFIGEILPDGFGTHYPSSFEAIVQHFDD